VPQPDNKTTRQVRIELDLWQAFGEATKTMNSDRSSVMRAFMRWYAHQPGATLPPRPRSDRPSLTALSEQSAKVRDDLAAVVRAARVAIEDGADPVDVLRATEGLLP
jgi:hypothetical protein